MIPMILVMMRIITINLKKEEDSEKKWNEKKIVKIKQKKIRKKEKKKIYVNMGKEKKEKKIKNLKRD